MPFGGGVFAIVIAGIIAMGLLSGGRGVSENYRGAVLMPIRAGLVAAALAGCGVGLICRNRWSYYGLLLLLPWAGLALASVFPTTLWKRDVPNTLLAFVVTCPLVLLISRRGSIESLRHNSESNWHKRGGALMLACTIIMSLYRLYVGASGLQGGGGGGGGGGVLLADYYYLKSLNEYVKREVVADVGLWNYVALFVTVSIPHFKRP
jgi:hypothetical protein